jgi:hypothetical protein
MNINSLSELRKTKAAYAKLTSKRKFHEHTQLLGVPT